MKSIYSGLIIAVSSLTLLSGCTKDTDADDDLIGNWARSYDFDGNARSEAVSFTIGDKVYIATGYNERERFADVWEFDLNKKYWKQVAAFPGTARNSAVAFTVNGKGYIATGYDGQFRLNDVWEYDPAGDSWTKKADFPGGGRYDAVGFAINGKGYISSGYDGNYLKDLWEYDPASDNWTQKASLGGTKRTAAVAFVVNNKAYICSGNNNGSVLNDLWIYDPATDDWTEKRKLTNSSDDSYDDDYANIARYNASVFQIDNLIYLVGGESGSLISAVWAYNPETDLWIQKTSFEGTSRVGAIGFNVNNRGFLITGRNGTLHFDNGYEFFPYDEVNENDN
ncbi:Kelch repeat-containing protein [Gynurincola endophyticus]|uniref:Kelch repeat-containing protein n=1 Tax=Gynurincola endophyticus TaxID=2479004 RepID=UPI000F8E98AA|nr:kelch repeat-containing protein [Gynurincola endophyticus]